MASMEKSVWSDLREFELSWKDVAAAAKDRQRWRQSVAQKASMHHGHGMNPGQGHVEEKVKVSLTQLTVTLQYKYLNTVCLYNHKPAKVLRVSMSNLVHLTSRTCRVCIRSWLLAKDSEVREKPLELGRTYHRRRRNHRMKI